MVLVLGTSAWPPSLFRWETHIVVLVTYIVVLLTYIVVLVLRTSLVAAESVRALEARLCSRALLPTLCVSSYLGGVCVLVLIAGGKYGTTYYICVLIRPTICVLILLLYVSSCSWRVASMQASTLEHDLELNLYKPLTKRLTKLRIMQASTLEHGLAVLVELVRHSVSRLISLSPSLPPLSLRGMCTATRVCTNTYNGKMFLFIYLFSSFLCFATLVSTNT